MLAACAIQHTAHARNLRCPGNLDTDQVVANSYDAAKYFRCTADGLLEELNCAYGEEFDALRGHCTQSAKLTADPETALLKTELASGQTEELEARLVQWREMVRNN